MRPYRCIYIVAHPGRSSWGVSGFNIGAIGCAFSVGTGIPLLLLIFLKPLDLVGCHCCSVLCLFVVCILAWLVAVGCHSCYTRWLYDNQRMPTKLEGHAAGNHSRTAWCGCQRPCDIAKAACDWRKPGLLIHRRVANFVFFLSYHLCI